MLRRLFACWLIPIVLLAPPALANCIGQDMLPEFRAEDPTGLDGMFAKAHAIPNSKGLFWKIEKPGAPASYLFGTFHANEVVDQVPDAVWAALDQARIALFELSPEEQEAMDARIRSDVHFTIDVNARPLLDDLSEGQRAVLTEAMQIRGIPVEAANQMRPWLLASLLGFPACHLKAAAAGVEVLDNVMADRAAQNGIPVEGLETYEDALEGFSEFDRDMLIKVMVADDSLLKREEDVFRTNALLYSAGETAAINELSIWLTERLDVDFDARAVNQALMVNLLDGRNRKWMAPLTKQLLRGNAFIGVGALHLPGQAGLIELLRNEGFIVTRLD